MESQKTLTGHRILSKSYRYHIACFQSALQSYSNQNYDSGIKTYKPMKQYREPRNKFMNLCQLIFNRVSRTHNREKIVSSINGVEPTGYPYIHMQKKNVGPLSQSILKKNKLKMN